MTEHYVRIVDDAVDYLTPQEFIRRQHQANLRRQYSDVAMVEPSPRLVLFSLLATATAGFAFGKLVVFVLSQLRSA